MTYSHMNSCTHIVLISYIVIPCTQLYSLSYCYLFIAMIATNKRTALLVRRDTWKLPSRLASQFLPPTLWASTAVVTAQLQMSEHFPTSCRDFVLTSKMKPKFEFLTAQVMPEFSIFSKCDMLQGFDMSHVTNNLYILHYMAQMCLEECFTS